MSATNIAKKNIADWQQSEIRHLILPTYDGSCQIVHPDLVEWHNEIWMACTPYPYGIDSYENPCIYHGSSVYSLEPIANNPIALPEVRAMWNHISDPCIFVNDEKVCVVFRDTIQTGGYATNKLYVSISEDGRNWTEKRLITASEEKALLSPAIMISDEAIYLFSVELNGSLFCSRLNDEFGIIDSTEVEANGLPEGKSIWHISIVNSTDYSKHCDNNSRLCGLFLLQDIEKDNNFELYSAHSQSIDSPWYIDDKISVSAAEDDVESYYKSAIIPHTGDVLLSFFDKSHRYCLCEVSGLRDKTDHTDAIVDSYRVFSRVFASDMSFEHFCYKHINNPYRTDPYFLLYSMGNTVYGTNSFMGAKALCGNDTWLLAQSCDTAVVPEARGKGIFTKIINNAVDVMREAEVDVLFGLPNNNSYHGFVKSGWEHIGNYSILIRINNVAKLLAARLGLVKYSYDKINEERIKQLGKQKGCELELLQRCPFNDEDFDLINRCGSKHGMYIYRSREYFQWKIDNNPATYRYLTIRKKGLLLAYIIFSINQKGKTTVVDMFVNDCEGCFEETIIYNQLSSCLKKIGFYTTIGMTIKGCTACTQFKKAGFTVDSRIINKSVVRFIIKPLSEKGNNVSRDISSWHLYPIDLDTTI